MALSKIETLKRQQPCRIERGVILLGGKWKASILWHLKDEPVRFNALSRIIVGASKKMITQRLKEMEEDGLIERKVLNERPIAVTYQASEFGRSAVGVLSQIKAWTEEQDL